MATDAFEEFVVGHGELWCAQLTAAKCRQLGADCAFMDARDVLVVRPTADGNSVDVEYEVGGGAGGGALCLHPPCTGWVWALQGAGLAWASLLCVGDWGGTSVVGGCPCG
jgi:hypothetical protein